MNRENLEKLKGIELIAYADGLGVKVSCNRSRTSLKESKAKVIDKIIAFEQANKSNENEVEDEKLLENEDKHEDKTCEAPEDLIEIFKNSGYELERTNRKNAETYTFKVGKVKVEICRNRKGITAYCSKNIIVGSVAVGNKFKATNIDLNNLKSIIKEV